MSEFGDEGGGFESEADWGGESGYEDSYGGSEMTLRQMWDQIGAAQAAEPPLPGVLKQGEVTSRFFDERGEPRDTPGEGSSDRLWGEWAAGQMAEVEEAAGQVHALNYAPSEAWQQAPGAAEFDAAAQRDAAMQVNGEAHRQQLVDEVRRVASGYGVKDDAAVAAAAQEIESARIGLFNSWLAQGATIPQALAALGDLDVAGGIEVALRPAARDASIANLKVGHWKAGFNQQRAMSRILGQPAPSLEERYPELARMRRQMEAHDARAAERKRQFEQANEHMRGVWFK